MENLWRQKMTVFELRALTFRLQLQLNVVRCRLRWRLLPLRSIVPFTTVLRRSEQDRGSIDLDRRKTVSGPGLPNFVLLS